MPLGSSSWSEIGSKWPVITLLISHSCTLSTKARTFSFLCTWEGVCVCVCELTALLHILLSWPSLTLGSRSDKDIWSNLWHQRTANLYLLLHWAWIPLTPRAKSNLHTGQSLMVYGVALLHWRACHCQIKHNPDPSCAKLLGAKLVVAPRQLLLLVRADLCVGKSVAERKVERDTIVNYLTFYLSIFLHKEQSSSLSLLYLLGLMALLPVPELRAMLLSTVARKWYDRSHLIASPEHRGGR